MAPPVPSATQTWHTTTYGSLSPTRPELSAKGRTVIVTGGGTGIGAETAIYFAQAGAARIGIFGRREQPLLDTKAAIEAQNSGVEVFVTSADISKKDQVDTAFARFLGDGGKVDVLVSNAAVPGPGDSLKTLDPNVFMDSIDVIVKGTLIVAQAFLRHASEDAVAIDVNSAAAHADFMDTFATYSIGKMAVARLWDALAYANPKLAIFHIQPGIVDTAMNRAAGGIAAAGMEDHVSLPASFNVWLASPEARFLKGKFLWTNWDVDELKARAEEIENSPLLSIGLVGWPFDVGKYSTKWDLKETK